MKSHMRPHLSNLLSYAQFSQISNYLLICYCCVSALSIAMSQLLIVPLILYWVIIELTYALSDSHEQKTQEVNPNTIHSQLSIPIVTWLLLSFLASIIGVELSNALIELGKTSTYVLLPFCVWRSLTCGNISHQESKNRVSLYLLLLVISQTLAACHTIASTVVAEGILPKIPGALTESGQIALIFPPALVLLLFSLQSGQDKNSSCKQQPPFVIFGWSLLLVTTLLIGTWPQILHGVPKTTVQVAAFLLCIIILLFGFKLYRILSSQRITEFFFGNSKQRFSWRGVSLYAVALSFMFAALLINLKRGPWFGILTEIGVLGLLLSRRILLIAGAAVVIAYLVFPPIQHRVDQLDDHFNISGGRKYMWTLGFELAQRFPLGVGPDNARYIQVIDPTLPKLHRHMHNNLLNVAVESGWLGLAAYIWWMVAAILLGVRLWYARLRHKNSEYRDSALLALFLSVSLLGWQIAGLAEYNFGDGEIRLVAFLFMGVLLTLAHWDRAQRLHEGAKPNQKTISKR